MLPERFAKHEGRVRAMREGGLSYRQIAQALQADGVKVSVTTVWRLAADEHEERFQESNRKSCERRAVPA